MLLLFFGTVAKILMQLNGVSIVSPIKLVGGLTYLEIEPFQIKATSITSKTCLACKKPYIILIIVHFNQSQKSYLLDFIFLQKTIEIVFYILILDI